VLPEELDKFLFETFLLVMCMLVLNVVHDIGSLGCADAEPPKPSCHADSPVASLIHFDELPFKN